MSRVHVRLFGELTITVGDDLVVPITGKRTQALAIYLALEAAGTPSFRDASLLIIGGGDDDARIREVARDIRFALRSAPGAIVETADGIAFDREHVEIDVLEFDQLVESRSVTKLRTAVDLYRGNVAEGFTTGAAAFDDWLIERRLHYWREAVSAYGRLLSAQVKAGWWEAAVETASRLLRLDPTAEVVHRTLMRLQLEQGRPDSAMRRYEECAEVLRREFNREPSLETRRVRDEIVAALESAPAPRGAAKPLSGPTLVLVVEDEAITSALIEGYLVDAGFEVVVVADGADALMEIARRRFDLLLLDINIPTLDGLRLFEIMIQKGIDTPAVFLTGIPGPEVESRSLELGAAGFLRKPIRREVLIPHLRGILQRRNRQDAAVR